MSKTITQGSEAAGMEFKYFTASSPSLAQMSLALLPASSIEDCKKMQSSLSSSIYRMVETVAAVILAEVGGNSNITFFHNENKRARQAIFPHRRITTSAMSVKLRCAAASLEHRL